MCQLTLIYVVNYGKWQYDTETKPSSGWVRGALIARRVHCLLSTVQQKAYIYLKPLILEIRVYIFFPGMGDSTQILRKNIIPVVI